MPLYRAVRARAATGEFLQLVVTITIITNQETITSVVGNDDCCEGNNDGDHVDDEREADARNEGASGLQWRPSTAFEICCYGFEDLRKFKNNKRKPCCVVAISSTVSINQLIYDKLKLGIISSSQCERGLFICLGQESGDFYYIFFRIFYYL